MPELPDVETMREYLEATSLRQKISTVTVRDGYLLKRTSADELRRELKGRHFASTGRHGKYVFLEIANQDAGFVVLHFGMTGGVKYFKGTDSQPDYTRVLFHFVNDYRLAYYAMRKLGQVDLVGDARHFVDQKELGPDLLEPEFDFPAFLATVNGSRAMVKAVLMDQHTMAGIGNVYADEILFQAGIHPRTKVNRLDQGELRDLFGAMKDVLQTAIACRADPARFPESFIADSRHPGGLCPMCGAELHTVKVSSRTTYFCPNRQGRSGS